MEQKVVMWLDSRFSIVLFWGQSLLRGAVKEELDAVSGWGWTQVQRPKEKKFH